MTSVAAEQHDQAKSPTALDGRRLRSVLGQFSTGVTVVTYRDPDGSLRGATMNSFVSVSMAPPLVLVSVAREAKAREGLEGSEFTVNVLAANQLDLAMHFAGRPNDHITVPWSDRPTAPPRLCGTTAWIQCRPWRTYDGGDHVLVLGEVVHHDSRDLEPLTFLRGEFRRPGLKLLQMPRTRGFDGSPVPEWVGRAHQLHALADAGPDTEPPDF